MTNKGKHASQSPGTFYRDLAIMILGILVVGAAVFFLLYLFADEPATGPSSTTTTTSVATTSTGEDSTTTTGGDDSTSTTTTTAPDSSSTTVAVRPPSEVTVVVLNSMGLDGAAGRMTATLAEAGYQTLTPDNYEPELDPSRIWYRDGFAAEAATMTGFLPGANVEPLPVDQQSLQEDADVIMVLGTGFTEE